ncbi:MAG: Uncharacterized protein FD123_853 [Bacteroidetes bacterium]|nr:MAG: Uncharacterized protein FD123_853 [Bacteroidota bacterium]
MKKSKLFLAVSGLLFFAGCNTSVLPEKRPAELTVNLYEGGGMSPEGHHILLSKDSCVASYNAYRADHKVRFQLTAEEWDRLWTVFRESRFDRISQHEEEIYDRGGTSLSINWKDGHIEKSNSGMSIIDKGSVEEFSNCTDIVYQLISKRVEAEKKTVKFLADSSLFNDSTDIYLQMEYEMLSGDSLPENWSTELRLLPGSYNLWANYYLEGGPSYNRKLAGSLDVQFEIKENAVIKLLLEEGRLKAVSQ